MSLFRFAPPLAALMVAFPAGAQPAPPKAAPPADSAAMHEHCRAIMGSKMDAKQPHDHMRDKQGMMTWPHGKAPTPAEMQRMHEQCAAMMAKGAPPAPKKQP